MIVACPSCSRRYQNLEREFRCLCGADVPLQRINPFFPEIIRCSACGGSVDPESKRCTYCNNQVHEFDEGRYCVACFAFLERGAKFCSGCGSPAIEIDRIPLPKPLRCPRDRNPLQGLILGCFPLAECPACRGIWMNSREFELLIQSGGLTEQRADKPEKGRAVFEKTIAYISCPECGQQMSRKNFERISGVIMDTCLQHGVWLDVHELEDVSNFLLSGGLSRSLKARAEEEKRLVREVKRSRAARGKLDPGDGGVF